MEHRVNKVPQGWVVTQHSGPEDDSGQTVAGPFSQRAEAIEYIEQRNREAELTELELTAKARAEALSDGALAAALKAAIANPPNAPRGRPVPDNPREADIAFEYYWRIRQGNDQTHTVAAVAKLYDRTPDHVRKLRREYATVADYDGPLLNQLREDALKRRSRKPSSRPSLQMPTKLELVQQWLRGLLETHSQMRAESVFQRARFAGYAHRTVERAAHSLGIMKVGRGRATSWKLPPKKSAKRPI